MKLKDRVEELDRTVTALKTEWTEYSEQRNKRNLEKAKENILINARAMVDWNSTASVTKHYIISDISRLIPIAEPYHAGPLYYITLNAMSAISGLRYGFGNLKRSFIKFAINNMELEEPLAELLWVCRKDGRLGFFPQGVIINAKGRNCDIFEIYEKRIMINVVILAKEFLRVLESIDFRAMKCKLPRIQSDRDIQIQAREFLQKDSVEDVS